MGGLFPRFLSALGLDRALWRRLKKADFQGVSQWVSMTANQSLGQRY
jgi:hypothetical protein